MLKELWNKQVIIKIWLTVFSNQVNISLTIILLQIFYTAIGQPVYWCDTADNGWIVTSDYSVYIVIVNGQPDLTTSACIQKLETCLYLEY